MKHGLSYTVYGNIQEIIPMTGLNHLENQLLQLPPLMPTSCTAWQLGYHLLHVSIFATKLQLTGTPRNKQLWKQQHMGQSLWQPRQPQNRSWIYDTY